MLLSRWLRRLRARYLRPRALHSPHWQRPRLETLEERECPSITIQLDYSLDTQGFFNNQQRRDLLQRAADTVGAHFTDSLSAIAPGGGNTWTATLTHPGTGATQNVVDLQVPANTLIVYAGARSDLTGIGLGGPGGFSASGTQQWLDLVQGRGQAGALGASTGRTDFGPWGGSISFLTTANWHFGETTTGLDGTENDFLSVALHELTHLVGFGTSPAWTNRVSGGLFTGPLATAARDGGGSPPVSNSHWAEGLMDGGQETAMDPTLTQGTRKLITGLDRAALGDMGWQLGTDTDGTLATANVSGIGVSTSNITITSERLETGTDVDFYRLEATTGQRVSFTTAPRAGQATVDTYLRVFDANGVELTTADDGGPASGYAGLTYTIPAAGTYYVAVSAGPNRSYLPTEAFARSLAGSTGAYDLNIAVVSSTTTFLAFGPDPQFGPVFFGEPLTITAGIGTQVPGGIPTGTVTFFDGATVIGSASVQASNQQASITVSNLPIGPRSIRAVYQGDGTFQGSTSDPRNFDITLHTFGAPLNLPVGSSPLGIALGDFNNDGIQDLVSANTGSANVSVLLSNGDGTFKAARNAPTGNSPWAVAAGLIDNDSNVDLITADAGTTSISLLRGLGNGMFQPPVTFAVGMQPTALALLDIDGDGDLDVAVANRDSNSVSVLLGTGTGSFAPQTTYAVGNAPSAVALEDVNSDGKPDLLVTNRGSNNVSVLLNQVNGVFGAPTTFPAGSLPTDVLVGDFNGDSKQDLVFVNNTNNGYSYFLSGNGNGTFQDRGSFGLLNLYPTAAAVGDLNHNGKPDFVYTNAGDFCGLCAVPFGAILLDGDPQTGFNAHRRDFFAVDSSPYDVVLHDFNQDGNLDAAVVNSRSTTVSVVLNQTGTHTTLESSIPLPVFGQSVTFTATVTADLAGATTPFGNVIFKDGDAILATVPLVNGAATFTTSALTVGAHLITADTDLYSSYSNSSTSLMQAVARASSSTALVSSLSPSGFEQNITLTATVSALAPGTGTPTGTISFKDGSTTLGTAPLSGGTATLVLNSLFVGSHNLTAEYNGDAGFKSSVSASLSQTVVPRLFSDPFAVPVGTAPVALAFGYLDPEYVTDLVVANAGSNNIQVLLGQGDGTFTTAATINTTTAPRGVVLADFNLDDKLDLAWIRDGSNRVHVALGNGNGTFAAATTLTVGTTPVAVIAADVDFDSRLDLVVVNRDSFNVSVLLGNGNGSFEAARNFAVTATPSAVVAGFFTNDGDLDLAVTNRTANSVTLLRGDGEGSFTADPDLPVGSGPVALVEGDYDNDGDADLIVANSTGNSVSSLRNNGNGTFAPATSLATGQGPTSLLLFDYHVDGKLDLVVANKTSNTIQFFMGNGNGTFVAPVTIATDAGPTALVTDDVTSDGAEDILVAQQTANTVGVLRSHANVLVFLDATATTVSTSQSVTFTATLFSYRQGAGTPTGTVTFKDGEQTLGTASLVNGVAQLTFSFVTPGVHHVQAFYNSDPTFAISTGDPVSITVFSPVTQTTLTSSANPAGFGQTITLTASVVAPNPGPAAVTGTVTFKSGTTILGTSQVTNGTATFSTRSLPVGSNSLTAEYSGNSSYNASVSSTVNQSMVFSLLGGPTSYEIGALPRQLTTADFNRDGKLDVVTANIVGDSASVFLGNGDGTFGPVQIIPVGRNPSDVAVGDVNNDGNIDFATSNYPGQEVAIILGNGDGTFRFGSAVPTSDRVNALAFGHFDTDNKLDLVVIDFQGIDNFSVSTLRGNGNGTFGSYTTYSVGGSQQDVEVADVNNDGKMDLVVSSYDAGAIYLLKGNGDGTFLPAIVIPAIGAFSDVDVADLNGDGILDFAVTPDFGTQVGVILGNSDGTYKPTVGLTVGRDPHELTIADLNGDGKLDIAVANRADLFISLLLGNGNGTFQTARSFATGVSNSAIIAGDTNGDGAPDLLIASDQNNAVNVLLNQSGTRVTLNSSAPTAGLGSSVTFTATVTAAFVGAGSPTGTVRFFVGSTLLATGTLVNGVASTDVVLPTAGNHQLTAVYVGDGQFSGSTSAVLNQQIDKGGTLTLVSANPDQPQFGQEVTLTATAGPTGLAQGPLTGVVTFKADGVTVGTSPLVDGKATFAINTLTIGEHTIHAMYEGDANFFASLSPGITVTVGRTASTTSLGSSLSPSSFGQEISLTATINPATATGTVTFKNGAVTLGTAPVVNGTAQFKTTALGVGLHSLTATYGGDANFNSSTSTAITQTVNKAATSTSVQASLTTPVFGQQITLTATVTPAFGANPPTGSVTFEALLNTLPVSTIVTLGTADLSNGTASLIVPNLDILAGSVRAVYQGNAQYEGSSAIPLTVTVNKATTTVGLSSAPRPSILNQPVLFTATVAAVAPGSGLPTGEVRLKEGSTTLGTATLSNGTATFTVSTLGLGNHTLTAEYVGDGNFLAGTSSGLQQAVQLGVATRLVFEVQPSNASAGAALNPAVTVRVLDAFNNLVATDNSTQVTIGGAPVNGTTLVTVSGGIATFSNLRINQAGVYSLTVSSGTLTGATSASFTITAAAPAQLVFGQQPTNVVAHTPPTPAVTVRVLDLFGNLVTEAATSVSLDLAANPGNTTLGGTKTVIAVNGVATFSNLLIDRAALGYTLSATATGLQGANSTSFNVVPGTAARLGFGVQPGNAAAGAPLTPALTVRVLDAFDNLVNTDSTTSITVAFGSNPGGGTLGGTKTRTAVGGTATFGDLFVNKTGSGYFLTASADGLNGASSGLFTITAAAAARLAFTVQPSDALVGTALTPAAAVEVRDAFDNLVADAANNVTIALDSNPSGAILGGVRMLQAVNGIASFNSLTVDRAGTGYTLRATGTNLTAAVSNPFNVGAGSTFKLTFGVAPGNALAGNVITPAIEVRLLDASNNLLNDNTTLVTLSLTDNEEGANLSGTASRTAIGGIARFDDLTINRGGSFTLTAAATGFTAATSSTFTITAEARTRTWDGGGTDGNWSTAANWVGDAVPLPGDDLVFPSAVARLAMSNTFPVGTSFRSIVFSGSGYDLGGNPIVVSQSLSDTSGSGSNLVRPNVTAPASNPIAVSAGGTLRLAGKLTLEGGGLTKGGGGILVLEGTSAWTGSAVIQAGTLRLGTAGALPPAGNGWQVAAGARLDLNDQSVTLPGLDGAGEVFLGTSGGNLHVGSSGATTTFSGVISGTGAVTKVGNGTLVLSGANTFVGPVNVQGGALGLGTANVLPDTAAVTVEAGRLELRGFNETIASISGAGALDLGAGTLTTGNNASVVFSGVVSGSGGLVKVGDGSLTLTNSQNSFAGPVEVKAGTLRIQSSTALGLNQPGVFKIILRTGSTLFLDPAGAALIGGYSLLLDGGTLLNQSGDNSWTGDITFNSGFLRVDAGTLTLAGPLLGTGGFSKTGVNDLILKPIQSSYAGETTVRQGKLVVAVPNALGSAASGTVVKENATLEFRGTSPITYEDPEKLTLEKCTVIVNQIGSNSFRGDLELVGNSTIDVQAGKLTLQGVVNVGGFVLTVKGEGTAEFEGRITGGGQLQFRGNRAVLRANNDFTGTTQVFLPGTLIVNGSLGGTIEVEEGATLGGKGVVGGVLVKPRGTLSPGESPELLNVTGGVRFEAEATALIEVFDVDAYVGRAFYDQVIVGNGFLDLTRSPKLNVVAPNGRIGVKPGDVLTIFDSKQPVQGTFQSLPEGAVVDLGAAGLFQISYVGGTDGFDVVLITGVPTATTISAEINPVGSGQAASLLVTVQAGGRIPVGKVRLQENGTILGSADLNNAGQIRFQPTLATGAHPLLAIFEGTVNYRTSTSTAVTVTVQPPPATNQGQVQLGSASFEVNENAGTLTIPVRRTGGSDGAVSITWSLSVPESLRLKQKADLATDLRNATNGMIAFAAGETEKALTITIFDDKLVEAEQETFVVTLTSPTGGLTLGTPAGAAIGIRDDDLPIVPDNPGQDRQRLEMAASGFGKSVEHYRDFVQKAYRRFLSRDPDEQGFVYWVSLMKLYEDSRHAEGLRQEDIEAGFLNSAEYKGRYGGIGRAWIEGIYKDLLGRPGDQAGIDFWMARLSEGVASTAVAKGFTGSEERLRNRVADTYRVLLDREPDQVGLEYWVAIFRQGGTTEDIVSGFVGSPEYYRDKRGLNNPAKWVREAYLDVLFRPASVGEFDYWLRFLEG